ncbi:hypothetical protein Peur_025854 [Populus x canadensis]
MSYLTLNVEYNLYRLNDRYRPFFSGEPKNVGMRCALYNEKGKREDGLANLHCPALINFDRKCKAPPSWQWNGNTGLSNGNQVDSKISKHSRRVLCKLRTFWIGTGQWNLHQKGNQVGYRIKSNSIRTKSG